MKKIILALIFSLITTQLFIGCVDQKKEILERQKKELDGC
jgi:hypothetical protein